MTRHLSPSAAATAIFVLTGGLLAATYAEARTPPVRGSGAVSTRHPGGGGANRGQMNTGNRPNVQGGNRTNVQGGNRGGNRTNIQGGNRTNISGNSINRNVNVNVDNDRHGWDWDDDYHPVARGVAFGAAAAVTSAAIGSMMYSLPPSCPPYYYGGRTYYSCNGAYYEPQYQGSNVVYVVVDQPR